MARQAAAPRARMLYQRFKKRQHQQQLRHQKRKRNKRAVALARRRHARISIARISATKHRKHCAARAVPGVWRDSTCVLTGVAVVMGIQTLSLHLIAWEAK